MPDVTALSMTDVQPKVGPALSATSDEPVVAAAPPPVSAEVNKDAPAAEVVTEEVVADKPAEDGGEPAKTDEPAPPTDEELLASDKTPAWLKGLATKERNKTRSEATARIAAEKVAAEATANLTKALESIDSLTKAQAARITAEADKEDPQPARETFEDPDAYTKALIDWSGRRAAIAAKAEAKQEFETKTANDARKAQQVENEKRSKETLEAFSQRKDDFVADHPDYAELVEREDLMISMPMTQVIVNAEDGPAIAYYLAKNPDEAARIAKLAPVLAIAEMGKISVRIASKPAPATKPAPIKTLKTGTEAAVVTDPSNMSMDDYAARRTLQINNEKRARMGLPPLN